MKISVTCPTRGRKDILCRGIDSLINFLSDTADVEFLFRFDDDDISTLEEVMKYYETEDVHPISTTDKFRCGLYPKTSNKFRWGESTFTIIETISKKHDVTMKFIVGHRHRYHYLNRYIDELIYVSDGEYVVVWTDDFELIINDNYEGWDLLIGEGEGQHYIFLFRINSHTGKHGWPVVCPRKFFEINGRLCPNVLDDQWYNELCKLLSPDVRVILHWGVYHHCQFGTSVQDSTCQEGRMVWNSVRENNVSEDYEYYSYEDMVKIKEYMDEHPNIKKTTQYHDTSLSGIPLDPRGPSGRWNPENLRSVLNENNKG